MVSVSRPRSGKPVAAARVGTSGRASSGKTAHAANAAEYPAAAMSPPKTGGAIPAVSSWLVFCVPSARPLQNGPAISAIAVNARPLSLTVTTDATTITATASGECQ